jgi:hypothetical protein
MTKELMFEAIMFTRIIFGFLAFELIAMSIVRNIPKRQTQRKIFWSIALMMFNGSLLAIATGIVELVHEDFTPNQIGVLGIFTAFAFSVANVYLAEKSCKPDPKFKEMEAVHAKAVEPEFEVPIVEDSIQNETIKGYEPVRQIEEATTKEVPCGVVLSQRLDKPLARKIFQKAIDAGMMEEVDCHYHWKGDKVLLAYMCGRIYCGDIPKKGRYEDRPIWKYGNNDNFPDKDLNELFNVTLLRQSRQNRKDATVPNNSSRIDDFFD